MIFKAIKIALKTFLLSVLDNKWGTKLIYLLREVEGFFQYIIDLENIHDEANNGQRHESDRPLGIRFANLVIIFIAAVLFCILKTIFQPSEANLANWYATLDCVLDGIITGTSVANTISKWLSLLFIPAISRWILLPDIIGIIAGLVLGAIGAVSFLLFGRWFNRADKKAVNAKDNTTQENGEGEPPKWTTDRSYGIKVGIQLGISLALAVASLVCFFSGFGMLVTIGIYAVTILLGIVIGGVVLHQLFKDHLTDDNADFTYRVDRGLELSRLLGSVLGYTVVGVLLCAMSVPVTVGTVIGALCGTTIFSFLGVILTATNVLPEKWYQQFFADRELHLVAKGLVIVAGAACSIAGFCLAGPAGMLAGYAIGTLFVSLPYIYRLSKGLWRHTEEVPLQSAPKEVTGVTSLGLQQNLSLTHAKQNILINYVSIEERKTSTETQQHTDMLKNRFSEYRFAIYTGSFIGLLLGVLFGPIGFAAAPAIGMVIGLGIVFVYRQIKFHRYKQQDLVCQSVSLTNTFVQSCFNIVPGQKEILQYIHRGVFYVTNALSPTIKEKKVEDCYDKQCKQGLWTARKLPNTNEVSKLSLNTNCKPSL